MKKFYLIAFVLFGILLLFLKDIVFIEIDNTIAYSAVEQLNDDNFNKSTVSLGSKVDTAKRLYRIIAYLIILIPTFIHIRKK